MGLVERFSKLRSRWSRNFPPNLARLMLLGCAALWGGSYLLAKFAMEAIPPQWLMGLRMIGACLCMLALFHKHIVPYLTPKIIVPALVVGLTYWGTMVTQTIGLQTIEPGRSAFLTAAYCVLTPFATWIISKNRPKAINLVAGVICLIGVGFVSLKPGGSLSLSAGDWLTIATAVIFSFNLTCLGVYTKRFDPIAVTFVQFGVAGVLFIIGALFTEPMPNASWLAPSVVASVLYLFLGATMSAQIHAEHRSGSRACLAGVNHHVYGKSVRCHVLRAVLGRDNHVEFTGGLCADLRRRADVGNQADQTVAAPELTIQFRPWMVMGSPLP